MTDSSWSRAKALFDAFVTELFRRLVNLIFLIDCLLFSVCPLGAAYRRVKLNLPEDTR